MRGVWKLTPAAVMVSLGAPALAEVDFQPRIAFGAMWTDNIELAGPAQPAEEEFVGEAFGSFRLSQRSSRVRSWLDYDLRHYEFADSSDRNTTYHQADGVIEMQAIANWLYLDATAGYSQQLIDPRRPINMTNNLFDVGNQSDTATWEASPRISHEFGRTRLDMSYSRGSVEYSLDDVTDPTLIAQISDADLEQHYFRFGSTRGGGPFEWAVLYRHEDNDYESAPDYLYETAFLEIAVPVSSDVALLLDGGRESDLPVSTIEGGFDADFWRAGFRWRPDARTELILSAGDRFFGTTVEASFRRQSRVLRTELTYTEDPTTEAQTFANGFGQRDEQGNAPEIIGDPFGALTTEPFVNRALTGSATLVGRRTELTFGIVSGEREYINTGLTERRHGFTIEADRRLSTRNTLSAEIGADRTKFREGGEDDTIDISLEFIHQISEQLGVSIGLTHLERDGDVQEYSAELANLRITKDF